MHASSPAPRFVGLVDSFLMDDEFDAGSWYDDPRASTLPDLRRLVGSGAFSSRQTLTSSREE